MTNRLSRPAPDAARRPLRNAPAPRSARAVLPRVATLAVAAVLAVAALGAAGAATLRVADQGDAPSMDPHSLAEAVQLAFLGNVFEPLVSNDRTLEPIPALATKWFLTSPTVWRFELRRGVKFRDDRPFTADDVVFSLERARGEGSDVKGKNPFKDKRDSADIDTRLPYDPATARRLLAEAGYPDGFEVTLNCPIDRYVNDSEVCVASAAYLGRVGVNVRVQAESKATCFPRVLKRDTSFFMVGWSPAGYDAHNALFYPMATPGASGQGSWNMGACSNARPDKLTADIQVETDPARRAAQMREALTLRRDDVGHVPMHQQSLSWGMRASDDVAQRADNYMFFRWATVR